MKSEVYVLSVLEKSLHPGKHRESNNKDGSESKIGGKCRMDLLKWNHPMDPGRERHIAQGQSTDLIRQAKARKTSTAFSMFGA